MSVPSKIFSIINSFFRPLDRFFNRIYGTRYNPLYQTGTITVSLLTFALISGLYLIFFYRLSAPYESVLHIQNHIFLGKWVRSFHRYVSDAAVIAVIIHILRMILQAKTWGPRTLAWISGVVSVMFLMISGWTGFVMVWDQQGQRLAQTGAKILDQLPIFPEPISHGFTGAIPPSSSFFFMNLFLHVAIPLGMILVLWIHTSRIKTSVWFPQKKLNLFLVLSFVVLSVFWVSPLAPKADLLHILGKHPVDLYYNFWLLFVDQSSQMILWFLGVGVLLLLTVPWWLKPPISIRPQPSFNNPLICEGCSQCYNDCPYEAITMIPRTVGKGSPIVAQVNPNKCVSCGICAASCTTYTIGPPGRKGPDQLATMRSFKDLHPEPTPSTHVLMYCTSNSIEAELAQYQSQHPETLLYPMACGGTIHATVVDQLVKTYGQITMLCCPPRNCQNRGGIELLQNRLSGVITPTLSEKVSRSQINLVTYGTGDGNLASHMAHTPGRKNRWVALLTTSILLAGLAMLSAFSTGTDALHGKIRLSFRIPSGYVENCITRTPEELAKLPVHMRLPKVCERKPVTYQLSVKVDGRESISRKIHHGGYRSDRPIYVDEEVSLIPGHHAVEMILNPEHPQKEASLLNLQWSGDVHILQGKIVLFMYDSTHQNIIIK